jgi:hypothetical protein
MFLLQYLLLKPLQSSFESYLQLVYTILEVHI